MNTLPTYEPSAQAEGASPSGRLVASPTSALLTQRGYRPMTDLERRAIAAAAYRTVVYPVASPPKRLARSLSAQLTSTGLITDRQAWALWRLVHTFRRQIGAVDPGVLDHAAMHKDDPCPPPIRKATTP